MKNTIDIVIIGGGPAGLAAAQGAHEEGARDILILERDYDSLGGILNQCIHNGFGLHRFGEELTGPEYAERDITRIRDLGIAFELGTMVTGITPDRTITAVNEKGVHEIKAKAIILAMGCRERPRGALNIPGTRPAGIFTAGTAQKFVNIDGYMPGREVVILGSGDIGLIMARRMTLEGATVKAVAEILPRPGGLKRNVAQCLDDFGIPLHLSTTVTRIAGRERVSGVDLTDVDEQRRPVPSTTRHISCDTLLLSVGLLPENELSRQAGVEILPATGGPVADAGLQTNTPGIFACGNVLHVHDLADSVSRESLLAGRNAARLIADKPFLPADAPPKTEEEAGSTARRDDPHTMTCVNCPIGCTLTVEIGGDGALAVKGNRCPRGHDYAVAEMTNPTRMVASTVRLRNGTVEQLPVKTNRPVPKKRILDSVRALANIEVAAPVARGQVIVENICGTGVDIIATRSVPKK